ncbi:MAG: 2-oxo acid dehydrogenase subunit E2 [Chloroflexi bacterium]|nr:2-oxo acid dehydrogenase subunit E2 [Chloroflexota bacterium]
MATELTMPQMGYDMQEGTVVRWLVEEGAEVKTGDPVAEIETDKAVVEFESYATGILHRILVPEGSTVPVGQAIAIVGAPDEVVNGASAAPPAAAAPAATEDDGAVEPPPAEPSKAATPLPGPAEVLVPPPAPAPTATPLPVRASPVARRLADEMGIDLSQVVGTGPGGRITKDDVLAIHAPQEAAPPTPEPEPVVEAPAPAETVVDAAPTPVSLPAEELTAQPRRPVTHAAAEAEPLSRMRRQIARVTLRSKQEKPHFYVTSEIDMTDAMDMRRQVNAALEEQGGRITVNDLIIKACVDALKRFPKVNAFLQDDGIVTNDKVNVGVAMAVNEGLMMPAILDCGGMSLTEIGEASRDLADRAQQGTLHSDEYTGGTFGISNLGMFDVTTFVAIIQPPQTAILAVGTVSKNAVVRDDKIVVRQTMHATLSADHRVIDGAEGAQFLQDIKKSLENPLSLIL